MEEVFASSGSCKALTGVICSAVEHWSGTRWDWGFPELGSTLEPGAG